MPNQEDTFQASGRLSARCHGMPWRFKSCSFLTVAKWTTASFFSVCRQLLARPLQSNARSKNWLSLARADLRRRNPSACAGLTACVVSSHSVTVRTPPFQLSGLHAKATNVSEVANDISDFLIASRRGYMRSCFAQAACLARKEGDLQFGKPQRTRLLSADAPLVTAVRWNSSQMELV